MGMQNCSSAIRESRQACSAINHPLPGDYHPLAGDQSPAARQFITDYSVVNLSAINNPHRREQAGRQRHVDYEEERAAADLIRVFNVAA